MPRSPARFDTLLHAALQRLVKPPERGVLLAVSGGADSVALLVGSARLAPALGLRLEVAWLDHGLRPDVAHEGALVARLAAARGLPFHRRALALEGGAGIEARARKAREAALEAIREAQGLQLIATGHSASDQAETVLMRLARGASLRGAAGILARKGRLIRPLLDFTREELQAVLTAEGLSWVEDPMNADPSFLRVRMRREVLPSLEQAAGAGATSRLARFAGWAAEDEAHLEAEAQEAFHRLSLSPGTLDAVGLRALAPALRRRVLARLIEPQAGALTAMRLADVLRALEAGRRCEVGRGWQLASASGQVRLVPPSSRTPAPPCSLVLAGAHGEVTWGGWRVGWQRGSTPSPARYGFPLSAAQLAGTPTLHLRARRAGDRVRLPDGHTRSLGDVLVDARIPRERRGDWPVVTGEEGEVLWVPGAVRATLESPSGWLWAEPVATTNERGE